MLFYSEIFEVAVAVPDHKGKNVIRLTANGNLITGVHMIATDKFFIDIDTVSACSHSAIVSHCDCDLIFFTMGCIGVGDVVAVA